MTARHEVHDLDLDQEIADLKTAIASTRRQISLHAAPLLSAVRAPSAPPHPAALQQLARRQAAHDAQSLHRLCAGGVTSFRARDPSPQAADAGRLLGLRIEAVSRGRFLRPYYMLLHRLAPVDGAPLRVHRHTLPPVIPLAALAARHLPAAGRPDVAGFARAVRHAVVAYHNRLGVIADMKRAVGLSARRAQPVAEETAVRVVHMAPTDAEACQVRIDWSDGRTGRLVLGPDGRVERAVVVKADGGRDRDRARLLLWLRARATDNQDGGDDHRPVVLAGVEEVLARLRDGVPTDR